MNDLRRRLAQALHDANVGDDGPPRNHDFDAARLIPAMQLNGLALTPQSEGLDVERVLRDLADAVVRLPEPTLGLRGGVNRGRVIDLILEARAALSSKGAGE